MLRREFHWEKLIKVCSFEGLELFRWQIIDSAIIQEVKLTEDNGLLKSGLTKSRSRRALLLLLELGGGIPKDVIVIALSLIWKGIGCSAWESRRLRLLGLCEANINIRRGLCKGCPSPKSDVWCSWSLWEREGEISGSLLLLLRGYHSHWRSLILCRKGEWEGRGRWCWCWCWRLKLHAAKGTSAKSTAPRWERWSCSQKGASSWLLLLRNCWSSSTENAWATKRGLRCRGCCS